MKREIETQENSAARKNSLSLITLLFKFFNHPLNTLSAAALVVTASARLAYALVAAVCLVFVFTLSFFIMFLAEKQNNYLAEKTEARLLPKKGKKLIFILIANFSGCIFYFCYYLFNPLLASETIFITLFVPVLAYFYNANKNKVEIAEEGILSVKNRFFDAVKLGFLIIIFSLIREPLGYATLTLPFGNGGTTEMFNKDGSFPFPIEIISLSSGAFWILGFIIALFRAIDRRKTERQ